MTKRLLNDEDVRRLQDLVTHAQRALDRSQQGTLTDEELRFIARRAQAVTEAIFQNPDLQNDQGQRLTKVNLSPKKST